MNIPQQLKTLLCAALFLTGFLGDVCCEENALEYFLDAGSRTIPTPAIFRPAVDLSGRGSGAEKGWPAALADRRSIESWEDQIGFKGTFRLQYNLWEINETGKDKELQNKLLFSYEQVFKKITDAGGVVIVNLFGTPAGLSKVLDKKSPPIYLKIYKEIIKQHIRVLSCEKRYSIWYEVWSAPDLDTFFLGSKQEYLNLYRIVGEAINELENEYKINIPLGGPASSWWFQNFDGNSVVTPEKSLIYELIRWCYQYRLPLDFLSWHAYSTDPKAEKDMTIYNKDSLSLVRTWLTYFHFDRDVPLIIDEWNYDSGANLLPERRDKANIAASYIPARLKNMYEVGLARQVYFSLEDFQNNRENVVANVGLFRVDDESSEHKGRPKNMYNVFRMLGGLGKNMFVSPQLNSESVGAIATKEGDEIRILFYEYTDPQAARNYLSRGIALLSGGERKILLALNKSEKLDRIIEGKIDLRKVRATLRLRSWFSKAQDLYEKSAQSMILMRPITVRVSGLKGAYSLEIYKVDSSCQVNCQFSPVETKEESIAEGDVFQKIIALEPYSVQFLILKLRPGEVVPALVEAVVQTPVLANATEVNNEVQNESVKP